MKQGALRLFMMALVACGGLLGCNRNPSGPSAGPLAIGRWTGDGACLSVADTACNLAVGCGHGQFSRPTIRADGTFDVDGTVPHRGGADLDRAGTAGTLLGGRDRFTPDVKCDAERIASAGILRNDTDDCRNVPHSVCVGLLWSPSAG